MIMAIFTKSKLAGYHRPGTYEDPTATGPGLKSAITVEGERLDAIDENTFRFENAHSEVGVVSSATGKPLVKKGVSPCSFERMSRRKLT